jgi:hypothetical protein
MFSFWFDATRGPTTLTDHTLGLFKPGSPGAVTFAFEIPIFADGFEAGNTSAWSLAVP